MLELRDVHTYYGESHVLHGVSLTVGAGEVVSLLGRNGAGKTTTVRSIMGVPAPRRGVIRFNGRDVAGLPPHRVAKLGIGIVPEGRRIFPNLTVVEHLALAAKGSGRWDQRAVFALFPQLESRRHHTGRHLSGGEQQMLAIARCLMGNPTLVLMDEPVEGLAPKVVQEIMSAVRSLKGEVAILLVEHNPAMAVAVSDRLYFVADGRIVHEGTAAEVKAEPALVKRLVGVQVGA